MLLIYSWRWRKGGSVKDFHLTSLPDSTSQVANIRVLPEAKYIYPNFTFEKRLKQI